MNFSASIAYFFSLGNEMPAMKLGLESISILARACDDPQRKFPALHIAGTNGKGSTAAMTAAILRSAGYRTGLYTSPHLISATERVQVNGEQITEEDFARIATKVRAATEKLIEDGVFQAPPTFFEQMTMIAFLYFVEKEVDLVVLEVGLGGRLDATNICEPVVTAITPVGCDHQKYLGETLSEIAGEKAGIIKPGVPVIIALQEDEAMRAIVDRAVELSAPIISVADEIKKHKFEVEPDRKSPGRSVLRYRDYVAHLSLRGKHQATNALTAVHIVEKLNELGWTISSTAIVEGLEQTVWPGRLELIQTGSALLLLDGAHNAGGARVLRDFLIENYQEKPITLIFAAMTDKAIGEMCELLFPIAEKIILTKVYSPRAAEPGRIAALTDHQVVLRDNVRGAFDEAQRVTPPDGLIVACGSLFLVGEIKEELPAEMTTPCSKADSYQKIGQFWDSHDLSDY